MKLKLPENKIILSKFVNNFFLLPLVATLLFPLLFFAIIEDESTLYIVYIISILIPLIIRNVFNIKPFKFILISFVILIISILYSVVAFEYHSDVNVNTWEVILNTDEGESAEFYEAMKFVTKFVVILQIMMYFLYFYIFYKSNEKHDITKKSKIIWRVIALLLFLDFGLKGATKKTFPISFNRSVYQFIKEKYDESKFLESKLNKSFNAIQNNKLNKQGAETIVVVIGETLRKDHLQYYGYNKETTPFLKKEELICYTDVISPANQTVNSLKRVFSLAEFEDEMGYIKYPSLIKSFKEVGYKTYWLTTQKMYGIHDSQISYIARESDEVFFKNQGKIDEVLFNSYEEVLLNKESKKIIFIHLLGSHATYKKRIPESFSFFDKEETDDEKKKLINQYDDSVRYNDYVLSFFLNKLKEKEGENSFMMFSDHGESLFDSGDGLCGHGSLRPSKSEYNIPLVLWFSKEFKEKNKDTYNQVLVNKNEPIILSDLFHSLPSLYGIEFSKINKNKNFFGNTYIPHKKRKVLNGKKELIDYGTLKVKNN
ncbi:phosphoethanolamine transferase [Tenacibaculum finnmarkense]|uniref:phosphoethanolamine transferase n=1 Tax=Tenacibaculum finnmarkense TaxID=2781243 RepID=UPI003BB59F67